MVVTLHLQIINMKNSEIVLVLCLYPIWHDTQSSVYSALTTNKYQELSNCPSFMCIPYLTSHTVCFFGSNFIFHILRFGWKTVVTAFF